jgi:hypothetical protein
MYRRPSSRVVSLSHQRFSNPLRLSRSGSSGFKHDRLQATEPGSLPDSTGIRFTGEFMMDGGR